MPQRKFSLHKALYRLSPRAFAFAVWASLFGGACLVLGYLYLQSVRLQTEVLQQATRDLSRVAASLVDVELHEQLVAPAQLASSDYQRALAPLVRYHQQMPAAHSVYTLRIVNGTDLVFVLNTAADPSFRAEQLAKGKALQPATLLESYQLPYSAEKRAALLAALRAGDTWVDAEVFTDEFGIFISGHSPLFNSNKQFIGFTSVDYSADSYRQNIQALRTSGLVALGWSLLISIVLARLSMQLRQSVAQSLRRADMANKSLQFAKERAEQANKAKSEVLAIASHDLKNPIAAIGSMAVTIQALRQQGLDERVQEDELLNRINLTSQRMSSVIKAILDNQELESTTLVVEKERVNLLGICKAIMDFNGPAAAKKNLKVVTNFASKSEVHGDSILLHEALDNYVSNAIKYSPPGKTIYVSLRYLQSVRMVEFAVRDEGVGLTDEDLQKVFGKFQKLSARPTAGEHSTGLGLSIVKTIIELHDGSVGCDSKPGEGARFWARLPVPGAER